MQQNKQSVADKRIFSITALIIGALFSLFLVVGRSFRLRTDFSLITEAPWKAVLFFLLFWAVFTILLTLLYKWLDTLSSKPQSHTSTPTAASTTVELSNPAATPATEEPSTTSQKEVRDFRHPILTRMLLLLVFWWLFQIWFLPGNVPADPWHQLNMFLDYSYWNTHHPFVSTVTTGSIYWIGLQIGGKNMGTFLCVLIQDLAGAFAFANMITYVHRRSRSRVLSMACLLFMGLVPLFPAYVMSLGKDSFYLTYLTLFLLSYFRILLKDEEKYTKFILVIFGSMACMQRHDAIFLVIPTMIVLIFLVEGKEMKKRALIMALLILIVAFGERLFVSKVLDLHSDSRTEALSFPLQQIGRYVSKHNDELTQEEIETIDAVLIYEGMAERYEPWHSNAIKNYARKEATSEDWKNLFKFWAEKMVEDPLTYTESAINSMLGYIDPVYIRTESLDLYNYTKKKTSMTHAEYILPKQFQKNARSYMKFWRKFPLLHPFMAPAFYYWIYIVLLGAMLRRRRSRKTALIFVFPLLVFAICVASPISGSTRYTMPIATALPFYLMMVLEYYRPAKSEGAFHR